jgi:hypothetical protein
MAIVAGAAVCAPALPHSMRMQGECLVRRMRCEAYDSIDLPICIGENEHRIAYLYASIDV